VIGGVLLGLFGSDGTITSGSQSLSTSRAALVSSAADFRGMGGLAEVAGDPRLRVTATGREQDIFVGIGPAAQVDSYLASVPVDEVTDFEVDPFELTREPRPGSRRPAPPAAQGFWLAEASGRDAATLRWDVRDGDYRLVLMNADGSVGVEADGQVGVTLPLTSSIAWWLLGGGLVLMLGGVATSALSLRHRR
jgi:hypothetical protein